MRPSRRLEIVECFAEMVAEKGYDQVSLGAVAERLGMSKGTIVHHFGSKATILREIQRVYMDRLLLGGERIVEEFDSPIDQITGFVHQLMQVQETDRQATVAASREIRRFSSEADMASVIERRDRYENLIYEALERGVEAGEFRDVDIRLATLQIFGMCNWTWTWFRPSGPWHAEDIADAFLDVLLRGLATDSKETKARSREEVSRFVASAMESANETVSHAESLKEAQAVL